MGVYPKAIERLVIELGKLPGIGEKSAQRMAFHLIDAPEADVLGLSEALINVRQHVHLCPKCFSVTDQPICDICADSERDGGTICVVQSTRDIYAIERTGEYKGHYHVLHGLISPLDGIGPNEIKARELIRRLKENDIREVIMATNPTPEGEATAMYLSTLIRPSGILVSRLAKGIPVGADMEYIDEITMIKAFERREKI